MFKNVFSYIFFIYSFSIFISCSETDQIKKNQVYKATHEEGQFQKSQYNYEDSKIYKIHEIFQSILNKLNITSDWEDSDKLSLLKENIKFLMDTYLTKNGELTKNHHKLVNANSYIDNLKSEISRFKYIIFFSIKEKIDPQPFISTIINLLSEIEPDPSQINDGITFLTYLEETIKAIKNLMFKHKVHLEFIKDMENSLSELSEEETSTILDIYKNGIKYMDFIKKSNYSDEFLREHLKSWESFFEKLIVYINLIKSENESDHSNFIPSIDDIVDGEIKEQLIGSLNQAEKKIEDIQLELIFDSIVKIKGPEEETEESRLKNKLLKRARLRAQIKNSQIYKGTRPLKRSLSEPPEDFHRYISKKRLRY